MTFLEAFQTYSGISDPLISQVLSGSLLVLAFSIIVGCLIKTFFRS